MKQLLIAGGGPIGLLTAIRLKQLFKELHISDIEITVVDPRLGPYKESKDPEVEGTDTRTGKLNIAIFKEAEDEINKGAEEKTKYTLNPTKDQHIKDMVRELYKVAKSAGINLVRGKVTELVEGGVNIVKAKEKNNTPLKCDWIIDCTGSQRFFAHEINRLESKEPPFKVISELNPSIEDHFIAVVKMKPEDIVFAKEPAPDYNNPKKHTELLEKIRDMGWTEFDEPDFVIHVRDKNKVCLYYEIPATLKKEEYKQYLNTLLQLKSGVKNIGFDNISEESKRLKGVKKNRFNAFKNRPHKLVNSDDEFVSFHKSKQGPLIFFGGDTLYDPDYRIGKGIPYGLKMLRVMLESIKESGKLETIDLQKFQTKIASILTEYEGLLKKKVTLRENQLIVALSTEEMRYRETIGLISDGPQKEKLKTSLKSILIRQAQILLNDGLLRFRKIIDNDRIDVSEIIEGKGERILKQSMECFELAMQKMDGIQDDVKEKIKKTLLKMAMHLKYLGDELLSKNYFYESESYYHKAISLYLKYFPNQFSHLCATLYADLCDAYNRRNAYGETIKFADAGLAFLKKAPHAVEVQDIQDKLYLNKARALVSIALKDGDFFTVMNCAEVPTLLENIKNKTPLAAEIKKIQDKLSEMKNEPKTDNFGFRKK